MEGRAGLSNLTLAWNQSCQDEKLREIHVGQSTVESAFMATKQQCGNQKFHNSDKKPVFEGRKNNPTCTYCKKSGHTVEKCYRIIEFPSDFKFTKNKRFQGFKEMQHTL